MTKKDFLKRCETLWEMGFFKDRKISQSLRAACDAFLRLRDVYARHGDWFENIKRDTQGEIAIDNLTNFHSFDKTKTLANDDIAYNALYAASVLDHLCQACAEDKNAWHTRYAFCKHKGLGVHKK